MDRVYTDLQQHEERQEYLSALWETRSCDSYFSVNIYKDIYISGIIEVSDGTSKVMFHPFNLGYNIDTTKNNIIEYFKQKLEDEENWELVDTHYELFLDTEDLLIEDIEKELKQ